MIVIKTKLKNIAFFINSKNLTLSKNSMFYLSFFTIAHNVGHISSGGFRSESLLTEAKNTKEVLSLITHKTRHYLNVML
jgi:hypothetical protein